MKISTKKTLTQHSKEKTELTKEQEARFNKEFDKYYSERLKQFREDHGEKAKGMYFRWFDEEMYFMRQLKKQQFVEKEKNKNKDFDQRK